MPIITFFNPKGGSGKSTSALVVSSELAANGGTVGIIDGDPNSNLYRWAERRGMPTIDTHGHPTEGVADAVASIERKFGRAPFAAAKVTNVDELPNWVDAFDQRFAFSVLDPEGTANAWVGTAVTMSDLVIVPLRPAPMDADQMVRAVKLIEAQGRALRRPINYRVLFTCNSFIQTRDEREIRKFVVSKGHPVLKSSLLERAAYRAMFSKRLTLSEMTDADASNVGAARHNAAELVGEIIETLTTIRSKAA